MYIYICVYIYLSFLLSMYKIMSLQESKARSLEEVWDLVSKRLELSLQILELNDAGDYAPVQGQYI